MYTKVTVGKFKEDISSLIHKVFQCYITLPLLHVFRTTLEHNSFKLIHNPRTREYYSLISQKHVP